jgi:DNA uptake protein ComE-like DNA-binding protein
MKYILALWSLLVSYTFGQSIDDSTGQDMIRYRPVEQFFEDHSQTFQGQNLLEELSDRIESPIDVNTATREDLLAIPGMSPITVDLLLKRRTECNGFRGVSEIHDIEGIDARTLSTLRIFTGIRSTDRQPSLYVRSRYYYDFQPSRGQTTGAYEGSRIAESQRVRWKTGEHVEISFFAEKDAGEKSWTDFATGYFHITGIGYIRSLVVGDFKIENGNGIAFGSYSSFGKGNEEMEAMSHGTRGVIPYRSSGETGFFRGIGVNLQSGPLDGFLFLSRKYHDATLNDSGEISSLYDLGYHRTQTEKGKHDAAKVDVVGVQCGWSFIPDVTVGCLWYGAKFTPGFETAEEDVRSVPAGNIFTSMAVNYLATFPIGASSESVQLSGEWMRDRGGTIGGVTILLLRLKKFQCDAGYRWYPEKFLSLFGSGFGEHGETLQNESGLYVGFRTDITQDIRAYVSSDFYRFPWRTYRNPLPTSGRNIQVDLEMNVMKRFQARVRYGLDMREETAVKRRQVFRGDADIAPWKSIELRTRIEVIHVNDIAVEDGVLVYENIRADIFHQFRIEGRVEYFRTDSYASALYAYESDVAGAFTVPMVYGSGMRWYIMGSYSIGKKVVLCLKYSELRKNNVESLGSGYDRIDSGVDNSLHLQLDIAL